MNRRSALAAAAAISLSITGIAAAAGATMHVFDAAEASPNLGKVSPVSTTTRPPTVEHRVLVVDDPAPAPAPESAPAGGEVARAETPRAEQPPTSVPEPEVAAPSAPAPGPTTQPAAIPPTAPVREPGHELGDD